MIKTPRLNLRPFTSQDFDLLYSLHANPEVAKTTIDGIQPAHIIQNHLNSFIEHQEKYGYSQWAVFENESGKFVGRAGFTHRTLNQEVGPQTEIRYALLPEFWGQGYASELTLHLIKFAKEVLKLKKIAASTGLTNAKSLRVLEKYGFKLIKNIIPEGFAMSNEITYSELEL